MNTKELRASSMKELEEQLEGLLKEQFNLRMQQGTGQLSRPSQMHAVRRNIARIKTVMHEKKAESGR